MKGLYVVAAMVVAVIASVDGKATIQNQHDVKWYDCTGKPAGDYIHPWDCNRYMACSEGGIASEMDCADCHVDPVTCPDGMLVWDDNLKKCEWANETVCRVAGTTTLAPLPSSSTGSPIPSTTPDNNGDPEEGKPCDPELCKNWGYCDWFLRCDKTSKVWVKESCGTSLWNPDDITTGKPHIHGGNCDVLANLRPAVEELYRKDPECLACYWKSLGDCRSNYLYQAPGGSSRNEKILTCTSGHVFDGVSACKPCTDVNNAGGAPCCTPTTPKP